MACFLILYVRRPSVLLCCMKGLYQGLTCLIGFPHPLLALLQSTTGKDVAQVLGTLRWPGRQGRWQGAEAWC